ncbi:uncharacterized protein LOC127280606 [Leptopilina boulardi]|uniref:uncharacterized protein LOC127280606 n=1 Tax=Leptopilina boulardi TaxID=63433 RepID=UPI0021F643BC|nr:uncharacterized protein LOC127280606 [Leptopilina boulardi]XP_051159684.1 uncharacterized protein LOC127280606 [Leptopilina boulardi]XP_051159685.1 uncharacterized protein LOC127280606 [Leptopilina boulardi]
MSDKKKETNKSPPSRADIENAQRRVEQINAINRRNVSRQFVPLLPRRSDNNSGSNHNSNSVDSNRIRTVYSRFTPLFPRRCQQSDNGQNCNVNRVRRQLFPPRDEEHLNQEQSASTSVNFVYRQDQSQEIIPTNHQQLFPLQQDAHLNQEPNALPSFNFVYRQDQSLQEDISADHRQPEQPFLNDENTVMSINDNSQPFISNINNDDRTLSWQKNLNLLNIESSESGDLGEENEFQRCPIPRKRFKLNLGSDKRSEKTTNEAENEKNTPTEKFELPKSLSTQKNYANEPQPSTSKQADVQDAVSFISMVTKKSMKKTTDKIQNTRKKTPKKQSLKNKKETPQKVDKSSTTAVDDNDDDDDDDDDDDEDLKLQTKFTIKTGFSDSFCCCPELRDLVINQVKVLSRMTILVTIFINFALRHPTNDYLRKIWSEQGPDYNSIFPLFKENSTEPRTDAKKEMHNKLKNEFIPQFSEFMGGKFELFNCTNLSSQIQEMAIQLNVNYLTNLHYHARSRLATFFKHELFKKNKSTMKLNKKETTERQQERTRVYREKKLIRRLRNKKKREKWAKKKKKIKQLYREERRARRAELERLHPYEPHVEKLIFRNVKKLKQNRDIIQRQIVYDLPPKGKNRGKKYRERLTLKKNNKNWEKPSRKNKSSKPSTKKSKIINSKEATKKVQDNEEEEELNHRKIIKTKLDNLLKYNECDNETLKALNLENLDFRDLKRRKECHKFFIFFHRLQDYFAREGIKSFILVPIMSPGLKYITYTNTALKLLENELKKVAPDYTCTKKAPEKFTVNEITAQELMHKDIISPLKEKSKLLHAEKIGLERNFQYLEKANNPKNSEELSNIKNQIKEITKKLTPIKKEIQLENKRHQDIKNQRRPEKINENDERWNNMFDISKIQVNKEKLKFSKTIMTDGVAVSVIYNLVKPKNITNFSPLQQQESRDLTKYEVFKGLDPGLKFGFAGVERKMNDNFDIKCIDKHIKISTKSYRWQTQENKRQSILYNETKNYKKYYHDLQVSEKYRDKVNHKDPQQILISTEYLLTALKRNQPYFEKRKIAALKWDKYMSVQRETDLLANYMVGDVKRKQLLVIGSPEISPWMRGHVRMPLRKVVRRLIEKQSKYPNLRIVFIDEHRTTKLCSTCNENMDIFRNRTAYCASCKISWNRDVNAGRNILNLGLVKLGIINKEQLPNWSDFRALKNIQDWNE